MKTILALVLATLSLALCPVVGGSSYVFTTLDDPAADTINGERSRIFGINDAGAIVGDFGGHCFLYRGGLFTTIDVPGAAFTSCSGINNAGQIVGNVGDSDGHHGFLLSDATFTTLNVPGAGGTGSGTATRVQGINASGDIVGNFDDTHGTHGYRYHRGTFTTIDVPGAYWTKALGINGSGDIVGSTAFWT